LTKDGSSVIEVQEESISVKMLTINSKADKDIELVMTYHPESIESVPKLENAYQYLQFEPVLTSEDIDRSEIKFEVPQVWFERSGLVPETVTLHIYKDNQWHPLTTNLVAEGDSISYSAELDHLSYIAITAEARPEGRWKFGMKGLVLTGVLLILAVLAVVFFITRNKDKSGELEL